MNVKVSILIPVYKAEKYIEQCIHTVLCQTYDNIEYVIANDATPDNSMAIVQKTISQHPERAQSVVIIENDSNHGIAYTRNKLLEKATGDYLYFVDSDDFIMSDTIEKLVNVAKQQKADIVRCDYFQLSHGEVSIIKQCPFRNKEELLMQYIGAWDSTQAMWQLLVHKDVFAKHALSFQADINACEDYLMTIKLLYFANSIVDIKEPLYYYRIDNVQSITRTNKIIFQNEMVASMEVTIDFLKEKDIYTIYKCSALNRMFLCKQNYLINKKMRNIDKYLQICPESNTFYHSFNYNKQQQVLFWLAEHRYVTILKLITKLLL